ncbi:putative lipase C16A3.12c [Psilocybe cubensis]|uniref:Lipase C16A3.12c n=2 Tax=Psilocybe cubensis TaxID=181762 RepID=A0ACB8GIL8_PSICU|nr:putative lipase C16A3.12c [Psilocybe cubensis]KAH9475222.1 putative lipase C16A3.12c [Psilocybe cubensis]
MPLSAQPPSSDAIELDVAKKVKNAKNFRQICSIFGYQHEDHPIVTDDGYLLLLQRILPKGGTTNAEGQRRVVYMQHGLLTNSELFMRVTDSRKCIPLVLADQGYDVWMGNNRGNKYSRRHLHKKVDSPEYWDFCIDDFARHDIPTSIDYVLKHTGQEKLSYIGFSQGTAQAFASLSVHPDLNEKIDVFIALAPIMVPPGYSFSYLDSFVKRDPSIIYRIFGRKSMFPSVAMWQSILPASILHRIVDVAVMYLLGFYNKNITYAQKIAAYNNIYCSSSVKAVVHWSQIMRNSVFSTYEDGAGRSASSLTPYPTQGIKTPIVLIYGDHDSLFDLETALKHLPQNIKCRRLYDYEHLDVLWGGKVHEDVIPKVLEALVPCR